MVKHNFQIIYVVLHLFVSLHRHRHLEVFHQMRFLLPNHHFTVGLLGLLLQVFFFVIRHFQSNLLINHFPPSHRQASLPLKQVLSYSAGVVMINILSQFNQRSIFCWSCRDDQLGFSDSAPVFANALSKVFLCGRIMKKVF